MLQKRKLSGSKNVSIMEMDKFCIATKLKHVNQIQKQLLNG